MPKLILGFVGQAGSGKNTAAQILKSKYNAEIFVFSDILHDILKRLFLPPTRDNLIRLSQTVRETFGQDALSNAMEKQVTESKADIVVVDGIRRFEDIADLKKYPAFHLLEITAPPEVRFERLKRRKEKPGETEMTWDDFQAMSQRETEIHIAQVGEQAEFKVDNSGDLKALEGQIDALIAKLRQF